MTVDIWTIEWELIEIAHMARELPHRRCRAVVCEIQLLVFALPSLLCFCYYYFGHLRGAHPAHFTFRPGFIRLGGSAALQLLLPHSRLLIDQRAEETMMPAHPYRNGIKCNQLTPKWQTPLLLLRSHRADLNSIY